MKAGGKHHCFFSVTNDSTGDAYTDLMFHTVSERVRTTTEVSVCTWDLPSVAAFTGTVQRETVELQRQSKPNA